MIGNSKKKEGMGKVGSLTLNRYLHTLQVLHYLFNTSSLPLILCIKSKIINLQLISSIFKILFLYENGHFILPTEKGVDSKTRQEREEKRRTQKISTRYIFIQAKELLFHCLV